MNLGDGDDTAHSREGNVDGGAGNDVLTGEYARLIGGPGSDRLTAGPAGAVFVDGDGARPAPDRYEGSATAPDAISYSGRRDDLRLDLRRSGMMNEDYIANVDSATGGSGDDVLIGTDGRNVLDGGPGADRVVGLGGNDELFTDIDLGGTVVPEPAGRDLLDGGAGERQPPRPVARAARQRVPLRAGIRRDRSGPAARLRARRTARPSRSTTRCTSTSGCAPAGRVFLTDRDEPGLYTVRAVSGEVVARGRRTLRLNALGRRLVAARGRLRVTVEVRDRDGVNGFRTELQRM